MRTSIDRTARQKPLAEITFRRVATLSTSVKGLGGRKLILVVARALGAEEAHRGGFHRVSSDRRTIGRSLKGKAGGGREKLRYQLPKEHQHQGDVEEAGSGLRRAHPYRLPDRASRSE